MVSYQDYLPLWSETGSWIFWVPDQKGCQGIPHARSRKHLENHKIYIGTLHSTRLARSNFSMWRKTMKTNTKNICWWLSPPLFVFWVGAAILWMPSLKERACCYEPRQFSLVEYFLVVFAHCFPHVGFYFYPNSPRGVNDYTFCYFRPLVDKQIPQLPYFGCIKETLGFSNNNKTFPYSFLVSSDAISNTK